MNIRKNAALLTDEEWDRLLHCLIVLKHTRAADSNVTVYDQFVAIHWGVIALVGDQTTNGAHGGPAFLPWHREYLKRFEQALQSVDPRVTIPYWNWALGSDQETTALFQPDRMGSMGTVTSGYFALAPNQENPDGWPVRLDLRSGALGDAALKRNATLNMGPGWPTATGVAGLLTISSFNQFRPALEASPYHNRIHVRVGGDMVRMTSPNDPIFFLHHAQIDHIWAMWQKDHPGSANYNPLNTGGQGHKLNDWMWPWDGGASQTTTPNINNLLPFFPQTDRVSPVMVLNHRDLQYCYDDEENCPCPKPVAVVPPQFGTRIPRELVRPITWPGWENFPTTILRGEEDPPTLMFGEEDPPFPPTDPRIDDPVPPFRTDLRRRLAETELLSPLGRF